MIALKVQSYTELLGRKIPIFICGNIRSKIGNIHGPTCDPQDRAYIVGLQHQIVPDSHIVPGARECWSATCYSFVVAVIAAVRTKIAVLYHAGLIEHI